MRLIDALLEAAGETQVGKTPQPNHMDFEGYTDKDGNQITQKRTFEAQHYNDIPIPTWFVGNTSASLIAYWKDVNDCLSDAVTDGQLRPGLLAGPRRIPMPSLPPSAM